MSAYTNRAPARFTLPPQPPRAPPLHRARRRRARRLRERRYVPLASGKVSVTPDRLVLYDEDGTATTFAR